MIDIAAILVSVAGKKALEQLLTLFNGNKKALQKTYKQAFQNTVLWYEKEYPDKSGTKNNRFFDYQVTENELGKLLFLKPEPDIGLISRIELKQGESVPPEEVQAFLNHLRKEMGQIRECEAVLIEREKFLFFTGIKSDTAEIRKGINELISLKKGELALNKNILSNETQIAARKKTKQFPLFRIFVSSTFIDLKDYRKAAEEAINDLGQKFIGMEYLGAMDKEPTEASLDMVEQCELFVGVYAWRYGYIPENSKISITEQEYQHAKKLTKPRLCYLVEEEFSWPPKFIEKGDGAEKLKQLKEHIQGERVRNTFTDPKDFKYKLVLAISNWLLRNRPELEIKKHKLDWKKLHDAFLRRGLNQVSIKHVGGGLRGPECLELNDVFFELNAGKRSFNIGILKHKKVAGLGGLKNLERYAEVIGDHLWHFSQEHRDLSLREIDFDDEKKDDLFYQILEAVDHALQHESLLVDPIEFRKLIDSLATKLERKPEEIQAILHQVIEATIERTPVLDLLKSPCSALLIGDAGMGKTTAMRRLTLKLFAQLHDPGNEKIPIPLFVRLDKIANFMKEDQPLDQARQSLMTYICQHWQPDLTCKDDLCVEAIESNERPIQLILDGLDEIPSAKLRLKLAEVAKRLSENELFDIIITSRPTAINNALLKALGFQDFKLLDLTAPQIKAFVHKFFKIYHGKNEAPGKADAQAFLQALDSSEATQEFAANPLYLTIMILMHKKHTVLPKKRLQLYAEFYEMLLLQRATDPSLGKMADKPVFEVTDYKGETILWGVDDYSPLLQHIAFLTHSDDQDSVSISAERVLKAMEERGLQVELKSMSEKDFANRFLQFADNNLGILIYRGEFFGFSHRSLQQYLAAKHLSNFDIQQVINFWTDKVLKKLDRWVEVTRLLFCEIRSRQNFLKCIESQWLRDINDTKDARAIHTIGAIMSDLEGFYERSGVIRPLHQSLTGVLIKRRDRSHRQPPIFLACGDALGVMNELPIDVFDPPMVLLDPKLPFMMGSEESEHEKPIHSVQLSPYWIGKYPVTNKEFAEFIKQGGYENEAYWFDTESQLCFEARDFLRKGLKEKLPRYWLDERFGRGRPLAPVVGISWYEAMAYCMWLTKNTQGKKFRLPTEAEWEFAARGFEARRFPWGDTLAPRPELSNFRESKLEQTTVVGSYPQGATPVATEEEKLFDLAGNVVEWCFDWYYESYYQSSPDKNPMGPKTGHRRVLRGGSWVDYEYVLQCSYRFRDNPGYRNYYVGFRVSCGA